MAATVWLQVREEQDFHARGVDMVDGEVEVAHVLAP